MESLHFGDKLFNTLKGVEPIFTPQGDIRFISGRHSVLFGARVQGRLVGIKCYTSPQPLLEQLCNTLSALPEELIIHPTALPAELWAGDKYVDVALYPWVEGHSLDWEVRRAIHNRDKGLLERLYDEFCRLSQMILDQEWRHGDIKCENIIVRPDGSMILVDCDALFHPTLPGRGEVGTPPYIHPSRGDAYDLHIDDYAIALIVLSLAALKVDPTLADKEPMVASPSEGKREKLEAIFAHNSHLGTLLEELHGESYKLPQLKERLLCINPK